MIKIVLFFQAATLRSKAWRDKIAGIHRFALKARWQVQMVPADASASEIRYMLDAWKPIGCIVDRSRTNARNPTRVFRDLPVVFMDQNSKTATRRHSFVNHDSAASARLGIEELLQTGVETFSYVPYGRDTSWNRVRARTASSLVRAAGRCFIPWGTSPFVDALTSQEQDAQLARRLGEIPKPCGLLCANDQIAQRVARVAQRLGLDLPQDLVLVGIDNDELICEGSDPTISSVLPDFQTGGYLAAQVLDELIRKPGARPVTKLYGPIQLVRRQSTLRRRCGDALVNRAMEKIVREVLDPSFHTSGLAAALHCSRSLLEMRFRRELGKSIREVVQDLRMERAFALLRTPGQDIASIPSLCGYASESFFKRLFKKRTGLTMRAWRKRES